MFFALWYVSIGILLMISYDYWFLLVSKTNLCFHLEIFWGWCPAAWIWMMMMRGQSSSINSWTMRWQELQTKFAVLLIQASLLFGNFLLGRGRRYTSFTNRFVLRMILSALARQLSTALQCHGEKLWNFALPASTACARRATDWRVLWDTARTFCSMRKQPMNYSAISSWRGSIEKPIGTPGKWAGRTKKHCALFSTDLINPSPSSPVGRTGNYRRTRYSRDWVGQTSQYQLLYVTVMEQSSTWRRRGAWQVAVFVSLRWIWRVEVFLVGWTLLWICYLMNLLSHFTASASNPRLGVLASLHRSLQTRRSQGWPSISADAVVPAW